jgi:uncharacterized protein YcfJ
MHKISLFFCPGGKKHMKKTFAGLLLVACLLVGCATRTGTGALTGTAVGAMAGGLIGGSQGAIIGGALGAVSGGVIGSALDEQDRRIMARTSPRTVERMDKSEPLTTSDIIRLSQGGVSDETIIRYIRETNTTYNLSQVQVRRLQQGGVSQRIINYMVDTGR